MVRAVTNRMILAAYHIDPSAPYVFRCILIRAAYHIVPRPPAPPWKRKQRNRPWPEAVSGNKHVSRPPTSPKSEITSRITPLSIQVDHSPLRHRRYLRTCRACRRRYRPFMQSSLAPPGRAIRRPLIGWPLPTWRVCQREAPHPVAGGGHWRRSDRDGPVTGGDLDLGPARDGDVVLTRDRCETVVPAR